MPIFHKRRTRRKSKKYKERQKRLYQQNKSRRPKSSKLKSKGVSVAITVNPDDLYFHDSVPKHLTFFLNIMAETRVSNYFLVSSDTTTLMKSSTEAICNCIGRWKCENMGEDQLLDVLLRAYPHMQPQEQEQQQPSSSSSPDLSANPEEHEHRGGPEPFTNFGQQLMQLSDIIQSLQKDDPISFWTSGQLETMFKMLVPMARESAKLKRKLRRISDSLIPDLREMRRIAGVHGLLQNCSASSDQNAGSCVNAGGGKGSVIALMEKPQAMPVESEAGGFESVTDVGLQLRTKDSSTKASCLRMLECFQNIFKKSPKTPNSTASGKNSVDQKALAAILNEEIKTPEEKPSVKNLEKIASALATPKVHSIDYILDPSDAKLKLKALSDVNMEPTPAEIKAWQHLDLQCAESGCIVTPKSDEFSDVLASTVANYIPHKHNQNHLEEEAKKHLSSFDENISQGYSNFTQQSPHFNHHLQHGLHPHPDQNPNQNPMPINDVDQGFQDFKEQLHHGMLPLELRKPHPPPVELELELQISQSESDSRNIYNLVEKEKDYEVIFKTETETLDLMMSASSEDYGQSAIVEGSIGIEQQNENLQNFQDQDFQNIQNSQNSQNQIEISQLDQPQSQPQPEEMQPTFDEFGNLVQEMVPKQVEKSSNLNNNSQQFLTNFRNIIDEMHEAILHTIEDIRGVERSWMSTTTRASGFKSFLKLGDMLDYIRHTIRLLNDEEFSKQLYPQTRKDIIEGLEPVYREFHSCFIALGELTQIVSTDVLYLKSFMENMPRGDPIVYEFTSNSSLGSFDKVKMPDQENSGEGQDVPQDQEQAAEGENSGDENEIPARRVITPAPPTFTYHYPADIQQIFS